MSLCRVWAAMRWSGTPASAAVVAWPARSEWDGDACADKSAATARAKRPRDDVARQRFEADRAGPDPGEQCAWCLAPYGTPSGECGDRIGGGLLAVGNGDQFSVTYLVDLRL